MNFYRIYEWDTLKKSTQLTELNEELLKSYQSYSDDVYTSKKVIGNFKNKNVFIRDKDVLNHGNNVGILKINDDFTIELIPKFDKSELNNFWLFLPHMLQSLSGYDNFSERIFLDPQKKVQLPEGFSVVPLLALSFVKICQQVLEKGLLKKYVLKNEVLNTIRGCIHFTRWANKNSWDYSRIPCRYNDLTFDNLENRIILWCANRLLNEIRKLEGSQNSIYVGKKLRELYTLLFEEVSLEPQTISSFRKINLSGISNHYNDIMNLCQAILSEKLFSFNEDKRKKNFGINFIIDMDWVFESYMTNLFINVAEEQYKGKVIIETQAHNYLCDNNNIRIRPDLLIQVFDRSSKRFVTKAIIDFKWKSYKPNINADFYQIICYSLAEIQKNQSITIIEASLISVSDSESFNPKIVFDIISKALGGTSEVVIKKIPLNIEILTGNSLEKTEGKIKSEVVGKYLEYITNNYS